MLQIKKLLSLVIFFSQDIFSQPPITQLLYDSISFYFIRSLYILYK